MTTIAIRSLVVAVAVYGSVVMLPAQQPDPATEPLRSRELTARVFGDDGTWQWISSFENRPGPLVKSEKRVLTGGWQRDNIADGYVLVSIYVVDTLKDAQRWLALHAKGDKEWTRQPYQVGDGAWRAEHHPTGQIQLSFRRGLYVITVSAKDAALVERCSRQIVLYLDAI
jgi:hypothetical protein